jgi:Zn-dependent protease with chaperone function
MTIDCPHCGQPMLLSITPPEVLSQSPQISASDLLSAFNGPVAPTAVSFFYRLGLFLASVIMLLLPIIYLAMVAAAAWGVYLYATHFGYFLHSSRGGGRGYLLRLVAYFGPLFVGTVLVLFMVKPLFARRPRQAEPLALNPAVEPTLFAFIAKICDLVGAPMPQRIDLDCQLNASAGFRRGASSLFSNDLVLVIGLPLVAGLTVRELTGVIAHEFGHFTQGFGMRLSYIVRSINGWFARVVYERDAWDVTLEEAAMNAEDWRISLVIGCTRLAVWFSRLLLHGLMLVGHGTCCFLLRHMEYDADSYEIKLAGSEAFESTAVRLRVLNESLERTYKEIRTTWNVGRELPDNFPAHLMRQDERLPAVAREKIQDTVGLAKTGLFDTHPSDGDRIRRARLVNEPGIFHLELPATVLFSHFEVVSKQVTHLHYVDDLNIPVDASMLKPARPAVSAEMPAANALASAEELGQVAVPGKLKLRTSPVTEPPPEERA